MKTCSICGISKPENEFYRDIASKEDLKGNDQKHGKTLFANWMKYKEQNAER